MSLINRVNATATYFENRLKESGQTDTSNAEPITPLEKYSAFLNEQLKLEEEKIEKEKEKAEEAQREEEEKEQETEQKKAQEELTNEQVQRYMQELRNAMTDNTIGTDTSEGLLFKMTNSDEISDKDFSKIVSLYNRRFGNGEKDQLIKDLDERLCGEHKNSIIGKAADKLINAAKDELEHGNQSGEALRELSESMADTTIEEVEKAEDFLDAVMRGDTPAIIEALREKYPEYSNEEIEDNLQKTYSLYSENNLKDIIDMYS